MQSSSLVVGKICVRFFGLAGVATVRQKYLEHEFFSRSGKSQGTLWMAREILKELGKSGNSKINGFGRQSSENLFILFKRGKDVLSHEIKPISSSLGATHKGKNLLPWAANSFL